MKYGLILVVFIICPGPADIRAQSIVISDSTNFYIPEVSFLITHDDSISWADIKKDGPRSFKPKSGRLYFTEYDLHQELWFYGQIQNHSYKRNWYLVLDNPMLDRGRFLLLKNDTVIKDLTLGDRYKFTDRPVSARPLIYPIELDERQTYQIFINIDTDGRKANPVILLMTPDKFMEWESSKQSSFHLFAGLLVCLVLITFYLSWIFKDLVFRWLSLCLLTLLCASSFVWAIPAQYLWPDLEIDINLPVCFLFLHIFASFGFCKAFLSETISNPLAIKIFFWLMAMSLVFMILSMANGVFLYMMTWIMYKMVFVVYFLIFSIALFSFYRRRRDTLFLLAGVLVFTFTFFFMRASDKNAEHVFGSGESMLFYAIGCIFVCFAALDRLRVLKEYEKVYDLHQERERISRDLHDNIGTQISLMASGLNRLTRDPELLPAHMEQLHQNMNATMVELRDTIWAISKDEVSLEEMEDKINTLFWRLRQNNGLVKYQLELAGVDRKQKLKPAQAINLFRVLQEAINNSQKHSEANEVTVTMEQKNNFLFVTIMDNGKGFVTTTADQHEHYGLRNMKKRAEEIHALLSIVSEPGRGTWIQLKVNL